jgi:cation transport regulator ChaC
MKKLLCLLLIFMCSIFMMSNDAVAKKHKGGGSDPLNQLLKDLQKGGISQKDLKNINKGLENLLKKGSNKDDISNILFRMNRHGVSGGSLENSIKAWNDVINSGGSHKSAVDILTRTIDEGKAKQIKGNDLASLIQNALQQHKGGLGGFGNKMAVNDILRTLQNNGVSQNDLKGIDKQLMNILNKGGNKDLMSTLLQDMVRNGVTGNNLMDSVNSWNGAVDAGVSHERAHDIISTVLGDAKAKGYKDKQLAAAIEAALQQGRGGYGSGGEGDSVLLNDLLWSLQKNGVTQSDLKGIDKPLRNILRTGGNKDIMQSLLLDMVRNGVTGTYLMDSVNTWNSTINGGVSHQRSRDIISQVLGDAKSRGIKDKQLADLIQNALQQQVTGGRRSGR